ncbi:MAG: hypothetical protein HY645_09905 [Acidobacteria bacterium]|nr:hypothetical protein [Acidobacteriota bacterium]
MHLNRRDFLKFVGTAAAAQNAVLASSNAQLESRPPNVWARGNELRKEDFPRVSTSLLQTLETVSYHDNHVAHSQSISADNGSGFRGSNGVTASGVVLHNGNFSFSVPLVEVPGLGPDLHLALTYNSQVSMPLEDFIPEGPGVSTWTVVAGEYSGKGDRTVSTYLIDDFELTLRMRTTQPVAGELEITGTDQPWYVGWINFRYTSENERYYVHLKKDGYLELSKFQGGRQFLLDQVPTDLSPHEWHKFGISAHGPRIRVFLDDQLKIDFEDNTPIPFGRIAFEAFWCHARYDDLSVQHRESRLSNGFDQRSDAETTLFGYGWLSNWEARITELPSGAVLVRRTNGREDIFNARDSTGYVAPIGVNDLLTKHSLGYSLREKDGLGWSFDLNGQLRSIMDRNGNGATLESSGSRLSGITDASGRRLALAYGANGKVSAVTDPRGRTWRFDHDAGGRLIRILDPMGFALSYTYYPNTNNLESVFDKEGNRTLHNTYYYNDRVATQTDALDSTLRFTYLWDKTIVENREGAIWTYAFDNDYLAWTRDPLGNIESFAWERHSGNFGPGKLLSHDDKNRNRTSWQYDSNTNPILIFHWLGTQRPAIATTTSYEATYNQPVSVVDAKNNATSFTYDSQGNVATKTDPEGGMTEFRHDPRGNLIEIRDPRGFVTTHRYDLYGYRVETMDHLANITRHTYDLVGRLTAVTDSRGGTTQYAYDDNNRVLSVKNTLGHETVYRHDNNGRQRSVTDANGQRTTFEYDALGNMTSVTTPAGRTTFSYDSSNYLLLGKITKLSETDPLGQTRRYRYDALGRLVAETDALGATTGYLLDAEGNVLAVTDPLGNTTRHRYDFANRRIESLDPLGNTTRWDYDNAGNILQSIDANRNSTKYTYDRLNRVVVIEDPMGNRTRYSYDANSNLNRIQDPQGNVLSLEFDALGRRTVLRDPDVGDWHWNYDDRQGAVSQTDSEGQVTVLSHDLVGRLINKSYPNGQSIRYHYDDPNVRFSKGRLTKIEDQSGTTLFEYDAMGRRTRETKVIDGVQFAVEREYNGAGWMTGLRYPDGEKLTYTYDARGSITRIQGSNIYLSHASYYATAQVRSLVFGNGVLQEYAYYGGERVSSIKTNNGGLQHLSYSWDPAGNLLSLTDARNGATQSFRYDLLDRLIVAAGAYGNLQYRYDSIGNLLEKEGVRYTYGRDRLPHAVMAGSNGSVFVYNRRGEMVRRNDQTLAYDFEGRLIQCGDLRFVYDGDGGRVKKIAATEATVYVGGLFEVQNRVPVKHYFMGSNRIASRFGPELYLYQTDHIGSSNIVTDARGSRVQLTEYLPFGTVRRNVGVDAVKHKFTGKELDGSGLYFFGARYYDPLTGRFISPDPTIQKVYDPQDLNRYAYARNNPLRYVDPTGLGWKKFWKKVKEVVKDVWEEVKNPLISAAVAAVTVVFGFPVGLAVVAKVAAAAAAATATLDTGEGRQFVKRAGREFFDDVLGMRPETAHRWAAATTYSLLNAGYQIGFAQLSGLRTIDEVKPSGGRRVDPVGGFNFGVHGQDYALISRGEVVGGVKLAFWDQHIGIELKDLSRFGFVDRQDLFTSSPLKALKALAQGYGLSGISHQGVNTSLLEGGYSTTITGLFNLAHRSGIAGAHAGFTTYISTAVYGPYGGGLIGAVLNDQLND